MDINTNLNGYVGVAGIYKKIAARHIGVGGVWKKQLGKWIGKGGVWKFIYNDFDIDRVNTPIYITSLNAYNANRDNVIEINGYGLLTTKYPYPANSGCYYDFGINNNDIYGNYTAAELTGTPVRVTYLSESCYQYDDAADYITASTNVSSGISYISLAGNNYTLGLWFAIPTATLNGLSAKFWLTYSGVNANYTGIYIDNVDKKIKWIEVGGGVTRIVSSINAVSGDVWNAVAVAKSIVTISNSYLYVNGVFQGNPTSIVTLTEQSGLPIYLGAGMEWPGGTLSKSTGGYFKNFFIYAQALDQPNLVRLNQKKSPVIKLENRTNSADIQTVPIAWYNSETSNKKTFTVPDTIPAGKYWLYLNSNELNTNKLIFDIETVAKITTPVLVDFSDSNTKITDYFDKSNNTWGGANGGVVPENVYIENGMLVCQANGDRYTGYIQGTDDNGMKLLHTNPSDPLFNKPWTNRVGGMLTSKGVYGFGSYKVVAKLPLKLGVASAFWTFRYNEIYPNDPRWSSFLAEGLNILGTTAQYIVRNHEIDIEFPSHFTGGQSNNPSYSNMKCNMFIGESGDDLESKLTQCGANMSDGLFHEFRFDWHNDRVDYYIDGVLKQTTSTLAVLPNIPGKFNMGVWFPSAPLAAKPWLVDPVSAWAGGVTDADGGMKADFGIEKLYIKSFSFTPFVEAGERLIGDSYQPTPIIDTPPTPATLTYTNVNLHANTSGDLISGTIRIYDSQNVLQATYPFAANTANAAVQVPQAASWRMEIDMTSTDTVARIMEIYVAGVYQTEYSMAIGQTRTAAIYPKTGVFTTLQGSISISSY